MKDIILNKIKDVLTYDCYDSNKRKTYYNKVRKNTAGHLKEEIVKNEKK